MQPCNQQPRNLFCFGQGYCADNFAQVLQWDSVYGTHRGDLPLGDVARMKLREATHILLSIPPDEDGDLVLRAGYEMSPQWVGYLSTTGVYGNTDGEWVDENSMTNPNNARSEWRVKAEWQWRESGLPVHIFRLSGIYGSQSPNWGAKKNRSVIDELRAGTARRIGKEGQFFSRIHVEDIAQVLAASVVKPMPGEIFNCADDYPCSAAEVVEYAARLVGLELPPIVPYEEAELSPMARSFYASSRRVRNDKIKEVLEVSLKYPTYKEGLQAIAMMPSSVVDHTQ